MSPPRRIGRAFAMLIASSCLLAPAAVAAEAGDGLPIEPFARQLLARMSAFLAAADSLAYDAVTETVNVPEDGLPFRLRSEARVALRRPDRLYVDIESDEVHRRVTLEGTRVRLHDLLSDAYAVAEAPGGVEDTLDLLEGRLGVFVPMGYMLRRDPLTWVMDGVTALTYVGLEDVAGVSCHHVVARQPDMAWEAWIEDGNQSVPRKLVFHFADEGTTTTYTVLAETWRVPAHLLDEAFAPPMSDTAREIPLREVPGGGE